MNYTQLNDNYNLFDHLYRFKKFLLYFGYPMRVAEEVNVDMFCKIISEFALEYRTTRDRVLIQREKKANQRERKKTRGKMIVEASHTKLVGFVCNKRLIIVQVYSNNSPATVSNGFQFNFCSSFCHWLAIVFFNFLTI
jgi:hypothetical protein